LRLTQLRFYVPLDTKMGRLTELSICIQLDTTITETSFSVITKHGTEETKSNTTKQTRIK